MDSIDLVALAGAVCAADKRAVATALNLVEDRRPRMERALSELLSRLGEATAESGQRLGITGSPGVGKSSLVAVLTRELRQRGRTVGVVAVDPSSPRSGGAFLGDRARMAFDPSDAGVFVRSLATQGALGGLAQPTHAAVTVLAAAYDTVLIETVGVGQTETHVTQVADSVALVVQPGSGDVLQFLKAGIMEIPDLLLVNKADQGSLATTAAHDLKAALSAMHQVGVNDSVPPVLLVSARDRLGIEALAHALDAERARLSGAALRARRQQGGVAVAFDWLLRRVGEAGLAALGGPSAVRSELRAGLAGGRSGLAAAQALAAELSITRFTRS